MPHIAKASYGGSNKEVLLNTELIYPNGLAEDFASMHMLMKWNEFINKISYTTYYDSIG